MSPSSESEILVTQLVMSVSRNAGGIFFALKPLVQSLLNSNVRSNMVAPRDDFTEEDSVKWSPLTPQTYTITGPKSLGYSRQIASLIGSPDIQHMHGIWMYHSLINHRLAKKTNTPYMVSPHGMLDKWAVANSNWKKKVAGYLYENRHLRDAHCIHALCEAEAIAIREFGLQNPICIIPNGVDLPPLGMTTKNRPDACDSRKKQLLFLGRLHPKKGLAELFDAFARLKSELTRNWEIVVAGWGEKNYADKMNRHVCSLGIEKQVRFVGPKFGAKKEELYRRCDAFVLPSFSEGLPMSVLEAWSYAKTTLITRQCNLPEASFAQAAIECESGTPGVLNGLERLLRMPAEDCQAMGQNARTLVENKFNWPKIAIQMKSVYSWLLGNSSRPESIWNG